LKMNLPEFMSNLERVVEGSQEGRDRTSAMQENMTAKAEVRLKAKKDATPL
jgi:hypothetical protein